MAEANHLYPYVFRPILKSVVWGGQKIRPYKGLEPTDEPIGESWEISHVDGSFSVIDNGALSGKTIDDLLVYHGEELLGRHVFERFGRKFPLLIKFIDAREDLSVQVHPDDHLAAERHNSSGKTEMWYVLQAEPNARLYSGMAVQSSPDDYERRVTDGTIMDVLAEHKVHAGDVFFLPAGRIHAIGAGCFVAEIQQTSDITYRIYDYNRPDAEGRMRELHTEWAKDAINFQVEKSYQTDYRSCRNTAVELVDCPYFHTSVLELDQPLQRNLLEKDSFVIYMCLDGALTITDNRSNTIQLQQGRSVLIPAALADLQLMPQIACKLLETYIPPLSNSQHFSL
ncbi:type I phosphomannose isomerase catalytic subunit [Porphyromonas loveana]|uniref:Phosphohexomutase n=3 Tax=Porphyromonas loveana TaxID=1884669 RepID=A0A2U1FPG9_9PORP|nr:type I phosphomannose isomerase catalytic subunit [Porphyromonas loveana]PVZ14036.1 mannose-6-phosphate isomerase type 1 [Porphyromonas loveana]